MGRPSQEQLDNANRKKKEIFDEKQMAIRYALVHCLEKKSFVVMPFYKGKEC